MHSPNDGDQPLLRLLALKRHEVPPPGFFDRLPDRILVSIRAGSEIVEGPWWRRAWLGLVREPMVGVSYAALGVGAVLFGVSLLQTALDVDQPPPGILRGMMPGNLDFPVPTSSVLHPGVLYRVPEPGALIFVPSQSFPADYNSRPYEVRLEVQPTSGFLELLR